jgi:hypothetical protein
MKEGTESTSKDKDASSIPAPAKDRHYLLSLFAGAGGALAVFCLTLLGLHTTQNLPPPAFSNSLCVDEKLSFLRDNPISNPNLLVIGSSVAWRHVDGATLASNIPGARPLNGAFCGLHANQSIYVARWLLERHPTTEQVVMIVDPEDFAGCWKSRTEVFNRRDADDYVYNEGWRWKYYMRYFSPGSLIRNAKTVKAQRGDLVEFDPLVFNRYGDGPLNTENSRELLYGMPEALDKTCFQALKSLANHLDKEGRKFLVVSTPLNPDWKAKYDPYGAVMADFSLEIGHALAGTEATYWNAEKEWQASPESFIDAIHMRWSTVKQFTRVLASQIEKDSVATL